MFRTVREVYAASLKPQDILFNIYVARPLASPLVLLFSRLGIEIIFMVSFPSDSYIIESWCHI